jgi:hypothetical protein
MSDAWFRPKIYGYGATPTNWKGWAATLVFVGLVIGASLLTFGSQPLQASAVPVWKIAVWAAFVASATLGFVALCRAKTDGQWAWRWGK